MEDLVVAIASNLPVKSVLRFKSVSKSWSALFGTSSFTSLHSKTKTKTKTKIMVNSSLHRLDCFNVVSGGADNEPYQHEMYPFAINSAFTIVGSCDGLVCVTSSASGLERTHICNPATRESKLVPPRIHTGMVRRDNLRFVFNAASNDYNVISIDHGGRGSVQVQIYSLQADRWRLAEDVQVPESLRRDIKFHNFNTLARGIPSWLIRERDMIVTLDVSTLLFHETLLPPPGSSPNRYYPLQVLMTLDGCLALTLARRYEVAAEVWVLGEIGVRESWTKRFCINHYVTNSYGLWSDYGLVFNCSNSASSPRDEQEVAVYVFGEERVKSVQICGRLSEYNWPPGEYIQVVNYKETLVSPKMSLNIEQEYSACC